MLDTLDISREDLDLLVRLPFRVGMWVSQVDQTGGTESDLAERLMIENIIRSYTEDYLKSEFVQRLMEQTLLRRDEWIKWFDHLSHTPNECHQVMALLGGRIDHGDLMAFKYNLCEIAIAVALSYEENKPSVVAKWMDSFSGLFRSSYRRVGERIQNNRISGLERQALDTLGKALSVDWHQI